jgi:hypothetical protein
LERYFEDIPPVTLLRLAPGYAAVDCPLRALRGVFFPVAAVRSFVSVFVPKKEKKKRLAK